MNLKITFLKIAFLLPMLFAILLPKATLAAASHATEPVVSQHCFAEKKTVKRQRFVSRFLHHSKTSSLEKKKTDPLAIAVFIGGLASFILVFPVKFFLGFAILGLATLVMSIFAFRRMKRNGTKGRWLAITGVLLVLVVAGFFGLVLGALSKLQ